MTIKTVVSTIALTIETGDEDAAREIAVDILSALDHPSFLMEPDIMEMDCYD